MQRDPSIHVTQSAFRKILKDLDIKSFPIEDFFIRARGCSIDTRSISSTNARTNKKINNITLASNGDANLAADILYSVQIKLKHRGVRKINENNTRQWPLCKKLAEVCNTFCDDFKLDTRAGYIQYIMIGYKRMQGNHKNALNRLISMSENITLSYQAIQEINKDNNPLETSIIHDYYCEVIADRAGFKVDYKEDPEQYVHFVRLNNYLNKQGIDHEEWIDSQFEGLAWCNGIPDPDKLMGDKADRYYAKFRFKVNKPENELKVKGSLWDQIKESDD